MKTENISKEDFIVCADNILDDCEKLSWTDPENAETDIPYFVSRIKGNAECIKHMAEGINS